MASVSSSAGSAHLDETDRRPSRGAKGGHQTDSPSISSALNAAKAAKENAVAEATRAAVVSREADAALQAKHAADATAAHAAHLAREAEMAVLPGVRVLNAAASEPLAALANPNLSIAEFYTGRSLLITGGTGFMGKMVVEKLIRSCPRLDRIYLLVRRKGQHSPQERVNAMLESELFSLARQATPDFAQKVVAIPGELTEERMGMSDNDYELILNRVSVVMHVAATVKFNEKIKTAVEVNVLVVKRMMEMCLNMRSLISFIHVSTAYAHTTREFIEETVYPATFEPEKLIEVVSYLDTNMAESLAPHFVGQRPNTYTFTKSVAEALVASYSDRIPVAIVRPSIIGSTWKSPVPGWVDNFNGPAAVCLAAGTGVMRVMPGKEEALADVIPVDVVANFTLAVPWYVACKALHFRENQEVPVFNLTSGSTNSCKWETWVQRIIESYQKYPLENKIFRRPHFYFADGNSWYYWFRRQVYHILPARAADFLYRMVGKQPKMIKAVEKLDRVAKELGFFTNNDWKWDTRNCQSLIRSLSEHDRHEFECDMAKLHWPSYVEGMCIGVKKYLLHEDMARVHIARRIQTRMMVSNFFFKIALLSVIIKLLMPFLRRRGLARSSWLLVIPLILSSMS